MRGWERERGGWNSFSFSISRIGLLSLTLSFSLFKTFSFFFWPLFRLRNLSNVTPKGGKEGESKSSPFAALYGLSLDCFLCVCRTCTCLTFVLFSIFCFLSSTLLTIKWCFARKAPSQCDEFALLSGQRLFFTALQISPFQVKGFISD